MYPGFSPYTCKRMSSRGSLGSDGLYFVNEIPISWVPFFDMGRDDNVRAVFLDGVRLFIALLVLDKGWLPNYFQQIFHPSQIAGW